MDSSSGRNLIFSCFYLRTRKFSGTRVQYPQRHKDTTK
uniref:Uncharacterized protein n=1 Tax=Siphoviridae sp. ctzpQ31 TaxID=2823613 RepID=A0A8S5L810_9CAUD|nr:MAG TPA: hypothetical protein [Siphoviridae sp. ctzpQ31]